MELNQKGRKTKRGQNTMSKKKKDNFVVYFICQSIMFLIGFMAMRNQGALVFLAIVNFTILLNLLNDLYG